jgi:hypothetical protein
MKKVILMMILASIGTAQAGPVLQMNKAFSSLIELMPFMKKDSAFQDKKNEKTIGKNIDKLATSFKQAGHDTLIKHDLFAPSYELITDNIKEGSTAFRDGKKDYALWMMKETVTLCMDCHGRLPTSVTSSFQNGELIVDTKKIRDPYDLGVAYMIVRRFVDAKENFTRSIQDKVIKKDYTDLMLPFQHILAIELKIKKDPVGMISIINDYIAKHNLPREINVELESWKKRLEIWKNDEAVTKGLKSERELNLFLKRRLDPLKDKDSFDDAYKVDLLLSSGLISNYFFENQESPSAPYLSMWLGWIEKRLKKEEFMSSGDLFLKQCIRKYPRHPVAKECLEEYKESVEFDFTGSGGTVIPPEIDRELKNLRLLIQPPKN